MKSADTNLWGIHGGKTGDADTLFLKKGCVAVGWSKMGDLAALKPDRDAFKARVAEVYPEKKPGAIPNNAGQLFRFAHEMKPGDIVAYPSDRDAYGRLCALLTVGNRRAEKGSCELNLSDLKAYAAGQLFILALAGSQPQMRSADLGSELR